MIQALLPIALQAGATVLSSVLKSRGEGGQLAGRIVEVVADKIGSDRSVEAITRQYEDAPEVVAHAIKEAEAENIEALSEYLASQVEIERLFNERDAADASSQSWLRRNWRPINGVSFALNVTGVVWTVCFSMLYGVPTSLANNAVAIAMIGLIGPALLYQAGVVGYYVHARMREKKAGMA